MEFSIKQNKFQVIRIQANTAIGLQGRSINGYPGDWLIFAPEGNLAILPDKLFRLICEPLDKEAIKELTVVHPELKEDKIIPVEDKKSL